MRRLAFWTALLLSGWLFPACSPETENTPAPNSTRSIIIVITIDSLRQSRVGAYGYELPTTPALDEYAAGAYRFDRAYTESSWTKPALATLITGLPVREHLSVFAVGKTGDVVESLQEANQIDKDAKQKLIARGNLLPQNVEPFHSRLVDYRKAAFLNNPHLVEEMGFGRAWDVYRYYPFKWPKKSSGREKIFERGRAEEIHRDTLSFIDEHPEQNLFVWIHHNDVHWPSGPSGPHAETFRGDFSEEEFHPLSLRAHRKLAASAGEDHRSRLLLSSLYDAGLRRFDDELGVFFQGLRSRGLYDLATVLVTADHGEEFFDHGEFGHGNNLFDETTAIPFILKLSRQKEGGVITDPVSLVDIAPTVLDLAGIEPDSSLAGRSLLPVAGGGQRYDRPVVCELLKGGYEVTLIKGRHKLRWRFSLKQLIEELQSEERGLLTPALEELYDLRDDPGERTPLPPDQSGELLHGLRAELVSALGGRLNFYGRLKEELDSGRADEYVIPLTSGLPRHEKLKEELKALGYL